MEYLPIIAARLGLLHKCRCRWSSDAAPTRRYLGEYGELVGSSWLRQLGFKVLRRNFRWGQGGEVDLVCREGDTLVFCEVKSRSSDVFGAPSKAVNRTKRELIRRGAQKYLLLLGELVPYRFDMLEVILEAGKKPALRLTRGAFGDQEGRNIELVNKQVATKNFEKH